MTTQRKTPRWLGEKMLDALQVLTNNLTILEPSAGEGDLVDLLGIRYMENPVHCVELNEDKCKVLKNKGYTVYHADFLKLGFEKCYDRIIAAPPFKGGIDLQHIQKMYDILNPRGILVSLTTPYWVANNEPQQVEFREWLATKEHQLIILPENTFVEKGKSVLTAILKIVKK
jgi:hypothetical protein